MWNRFWLSISVLIVSNLSGACARQMAQRGVDASEVKLETDDSESQATAKLVDVSSIIENYVNGIVKNARRKVNPQNLEWTDAMKEEFLREVQLRSSGPRNGTGVGFHWGRLGFEISVLTEIEAHLMETLQEEKYEIKFTKFKDSIFRDNPVGLLTWNVPSHMSTLTADHSIAPVVRIGPNLIGIDKFAHFLEQGYWYFDATRLGLVQDSVERREFGLFMEGDPDLDKSLHSKYRSIYGRYCPACTRLGGFGYYGAKSTGVVSYADTDANEAGYGFYEQLWANPSDYELRFAEFSTANWNEQNNPSKLVSGVTLSPGHEKK